MSDNVSADTVHSSWDASFPSVGTLYNQTISKSVYVDSLKTTVTLAVTLGRFSFVNAQNTQGMLEVQVAVGATTRQQIAYAAQAPAAYPASAFDALVRSLGSYVNLPLNGGTWISFGRPIWFYGEWYSRIWITENGFASFNPNADRPDNLGKYTTPYPPATIPSNSDASPHGFVAPFMTKLAGGTIYYGSHFSALGNPVPVDEEGLVIAWTGVEDPRFGGLRSFAVRFTGYPGTEPAGRGLLPRSIDFIYKDSSCSGIVWRAGVENPEGKVGNQITTCPGSGTIQKFTTPQLVSKIMDVSTSATKYKTAGVNDDTSFINILGWNQGTNTVTYSPPGYNVALKGYVADEYLHKKDQTPLYFAIAQYGLLTVLPLFVVVAPEVALPAFEILDAAGVLADTVELIRSWQEAQQLEGSAAVVNPADNPHMTAWTKNQAVQALLPAGDPLKNQAWSIGILPQYDWYMDATPSTGVHHLDVQAVVDVYDGNTGAVMPLTLTIPLSIGTASGCNSQHFSDTIKVDWSPRTSPDGFAYNFGTNCQTVNAPGRTITDTVYHVDSTQATNQPQYVVEGWYPTGGENGNDLLLDAYGRLKVSGYFRLPDTQNSPLNLYVIKAYRDFGGGVIADDWIRNVVQTVPVLTPSAGTGWYYRVLAVDLGSSMADKRVKIAIGRPTVPGVPVGAEWTGLVAQTGGSGLWRLDLATDYGGTASVSPAVPADGTAISPIAGAYFFNSGTTVTATATASSSNTPFVSWTFDSAAVTANPYSFVMSGDHRLTAHFGIPVTISVNNAALGVTRPDAGYTYFYVAGSTVQVQAYPGASYRLGYWTKDGTNYVGTRDAYGNLLPFSFQLGTAAVSLRANFVPGSSRVLVLSSTTGGTTSPAAGTYVYGSTDSVAVTATASSGYSFSSWTLDGSMVYPNPITLSMMNDHALQPTFTGGGGGCVAAGTLVTMADGSTIAVEKLKVGDQVLGYDVSTGVYVIETIRALSSTKTGELLNFNGGALRTTVWDQPIYVRTAAGEKWIHDPNDIQVGWELFNSLTRTWVRVTSIAHEEGKFKVFDFTTDGPRTYLANGLLVLDKPPSQ